MAPCIKHRPGCRCGPCTGGPFKVTIDVSYSGCGGPPTDHAGTINSVTIGGTTITANMDGTYTSPGPGLPIVVNWSLGTLGSEVTHAVTRCADQTVAGHSGSDLANSLVLGTYPAGYTRECCGTSNLFPALTGPTLTLSCNLGTCLLYPEDNARCLWSGQIEVVDGYGFTHDYNFGFSITGDSSFIIAVQEIVSNPPAYTYYHAGPDCRNIGTGTVNPLNATFGGLADGVPHDCDALSATVGTITVTL
jgi:hypothetical protein